MSILAGQRRLQFGTSTIEYELTFSERKALVIHVYPDCSVVVDAPVGSDESAIEQKVLKRAAWILRQQRQFQDYPAASPLPRRYVSGEAYRYLGRQYRLKVVENRVESVRLARGFITVNVQDREDKTRIGELIHKWYLGHARRIFAERLQACFPRLAALDVPYPELAIRDMKARWGSCSPTGRLTLNLKLIYVPKVLIDYVVIHELCHLREHNHSPAFYQLLGKVLPEWRELRQQLNQFDLAA